MKKKVLLVTCAMVTAAFAIAALAEGQEKKLNGVIEVQQEEVELFSQNFDALAEYMGYDTEEKFEIFHKTAVFMGKYCTTKESFSYVESMILSGCDPDTTMDIYTFYLTTNEPMSIVKEMYDAVYTGETIENRDIVFENAFNKITNNKCGVLTEEEVLQWLEKGITVDDITEANLLSRKGVLTIHEILSLIEKNVGWETIIEEINGEKIELLTEDNISAVTYAMCVSRATDSSVDEILKEDAEEERLLNAEESVNGKLKKKGYWKARKGANYDIIVSKAREKKITDEKIAEIWEKGVNEADLINALNTSDCDTQSIDEKLERRVTE